MKKLFTKTLYQQIIFYFLFLILPSIVFAELSTLKFNENENCSTIDGELEAAKQAAIIACRWIEDIGAGDRNDEKSGFYKISKSRFCANNYVWIMKYIPDLTSTYPKEIKSILLHPTKPGIEDDLKMVHKVLAHGHRVGEQHNYAASLNNGKGCWEHYYWTKPGSENASEKISFIIRCKDKITGQLMIAAAGVHATHAKYKELNPPECRDTDNPSPYSK